MSSSKVTRRATPAMIPKRPEDAASRLKGDLMEDALNRMLGKADSKKQSAPGMPHVILALASFARGLGSRQAATAQDVRGGGRRRAEAEVCVLRPR